MSTPDIQVDEEEETSSETEHVEDTFKKLLRVPKSEVEELRTQERKGS